MPPLIRVLDRDHGYEMNVTGNYRQGRNARRQKKAAVSTVKENDQNDGEHKKNVRDGKNGLKCRAK